MSSSNVKVFYIGAKPVKKDNVLKRKHLNWNGYGSSQTVSAADAEVYFRYPTVWVSEEEFKKLKAAKAEALKVPLKSGTDDDDDGQDGDGQGQQTGSNTGGGLGELDREMLVQAAILQLKKDDPADYTSQNRPRVNRVVEIVGTNVSAEEIDTAIKALKHTGKL